MIRSAAKNHERVAVVVDPADYAARARGDRRARRDLRGHALPAGAQGVRPHGRLRRRHRVAPGAVRGATTRAPADFPETLHVRGTLARALRYGENPHQKAAFYALDGAPPGPSLARARGAAGQGAVLQQPARPGRGAAHLRRVRRARRRRSSSTTTPAARPSRTRASPTPTGARARPIRCRRSAASSPSTAPSTASWPARSSETFLECVIAPGVRAGGAAGRWRRARTCGCSSATSRPRAPRRARAAQRRGRLPGADARPRHRRGGRARRSSRSARRPPDELRDLDFAWRVCKHVKSNAIVFAAGGRTLGIGAGPDVARRFGPHRRLEGARAAGRFGRRVGRVLPLPRRRRRGGQGGRGRRHPARRLGARRRSRSPPPTSTASRWSSPASATSGTSDAIARDLLARWLRWTRARARLEARAEPAVRG